MSYDAPDFTELLRTTARVPKRRPETRLLPGDDIPLSKLALDDPFEDVDRLSAEPVESEAVALLGPQANVLPAVPA